MQWPVHRSAPTMFVPVTAVTNDQQHIFVERVRNGEVAWVDVVTGLSVNGNIEVFGDLKPGDEITSIITLGNLWRDTRRPRLILDCAYTCAISTGCTMVAPLERRRNNLRMRSETELAPRAPRPLKAATLGPRTAAAQARDHYEGLSLLYRLLWGEHLHHGLFRSGGE